MSVIHMHIAHSEENIEFKLFIIIVVNNVKL